MKLDRGRKSCMADIERINEHLQSRPVGQCRNEVDAVEATRWLDEHGVPTDRKDRPGPALEHAGFFREDLRGNRSD